MVPAGRFNEVRMRVKIKGNYPTHLRFTLARGTLLCVILESGNPKSIKNMTTRLAHASTNTSECFDFTSSAAQFRGSRLDDYRV